MSLPERCPFKKQNKTQNNKPASTSVLVFLQVADFLFVFGISRLVLNGGKYALMSSVDEL